jgi:transposase
MNKENDLTDHERFRKAVIDYREYHTLEATKKLFKTSIKTINRWCTQYAEEGTLTYKNRGGAHNIKVTPEGKLFLIEQVELENDLTLAELSIRYAEKFNQKIAQSTIHYHLNAQKITYKKKFL